jgi:hypothetical protein
LGKSSITITFLACLHYKRVLQDYYFGRVTLTIAEGALALADGE